eukprot:XP_001706694.1 Hypothetical protein GL50803_87523 [Giardia lamblia ATCC 50803]
MCDKETYTLIVAPQCCVHHCCHSESIPGPDLLYALCKKSNVIGICSFHERGCINGLTGRCKSLFGSFSSHEKPCF